MKVLTFFLYAIFLTGCIHDGLRIPAEPAIHPGVSPVCLLTDTLGINLKAYFRQPEKIRKIQTSKGLVVKWNKRKHTLRLRVTDSSQLFFNIRFYADTYHYDVPVFRGNKLCSQLPVWTNRVAGDTIFLCSDKLSLDWEVYVDDYKLDTTCLIKHGSHIGILVPPEFGMLERSRLRIWAYDSAGLSKGTEFSLKQGKLVKSPDQLDSLQLLAWEDKIQNFCCAPGQDKEELFCLLESGVTGWRTDTVADNKRKSDSILAPEALGSADLFKKSMALIVGEYIPLRVEKQIFAYLRSYFGEEWIVIANKRKEAATYKLNLPAKYRKTSFKALFGNRFSYNNSRLIVDVPANDIEVIYN